MSSFFSAKNREKEKEKKEDCEMLFQFSSLKKKQKGAKEHGEEGGNEQEKTFYEGTVEKHRSKNRVDMHLSISLPNCCSICLQKKDEEELAAVDKSIARICANKHAHFLFDMQKPERWKSLTFRRIASEFVEWEEQQFKRYCLFCFENTLRLHASKSSSYINFHDGKTFLLCPFCASEDEQNEDGDHQGKSLLKTNAIPHQKTLSEGFKTYFAARIARETTIRSNFVAFCPVADCQYMQIYGKISNPKNAALRKVVDCPRHGRKCILCWKRLSSAPNQGIARKKEEERVVGEQEGEGEKGEAAEEEEEKEGKEEEEGIALIEEEEGKEEEEDEEAHQLTCTNVPEELIPMIGEAGRCPYCCTAIVKNGGCPQMTCPCGRQFQWDNSVLIRLRRNNSLPPPPPPPAHTPLLNYRDIYEIYRLEEQYTTFLLGVLLVGLVLASFALHHAIDYLKSLL